MRASFLLTAAILVVGCSSASAPAPAEGTREGASTLRDGEPDVGVCASTFGDQLTPGFGRIDGTLVAIVRPVLDADCAMPNRDHVIVQVKANGAVYRLVVNVESDRDEPDKRVRLGRVEAPLPAPAFAEGWHTGVALDYPTLGLHSTKGFTPLELQPMVSEIVSELSTQIGLPISVYAVNGAGRPESAHKIHRNRAGTSADGAIVIAPATKTPRFLAFHFANQVF